MTVQRHEFIEMSIPGPGQLKSNLHNAISRVIIVPELRPDSVCGKFVSISSVCRVRAFVHEAAD